MSPFKRFLTKFALAGAESMRDDPAVSARDRIRYGRWARFLAHKLTTGRGALMAPSKPPHTTRER